MPVIIQDAATGAATATKPADQKLTYRGPGNDGIHRTQVDELSADEDGVISRKTGFIETENAESANKLMQDLASGKKVATMGGRQQRNGNIFTVTVSKVAAE